MKTYVPKPEWLVLDWHHACIDRQTLCIQHCSMCGRWRHPPRRCCPDCFSDSFEFLPAANAPVVIGPDLDIPKNESFSENVIFSQLN